MASMTAAFIARLLQDAGVAAIVGTKVHWEIVPEKTALPYVRLQVISDPRPNTLKSPHGGRVTRIQVDCFAEKFREVGALAEAVIAAVAAPAVVAGVRFGRTLAEGPVGGGEDTEKGFVHRARVDLLAEHAMA